MTSLPNPFASAASDAAADPAAAPFSQPPAQGAAAAPPDSGDTDCPPDEAAATPRQSDLAAADIPDLGTDDIGQIFAGARKLFDPDPAAYTSGDEAYYDLLRQLDDPHTADLIELPYGMEGIFDPPPLFLRQAVRA